MGQQRPQTGLLVHLDTDIEHVGIITKISGSTVWLDGEKSIYSLNRWTVV